MNNPKVSEIVSEGVEYNLPTYYVTENGLADGFGMNIKFCKGNKEDATILRQEGVLTESLIQVAKMFLEAVNKGDLSSRETSMAITKLDEALMWLQKGTDDRQLRQVQGTYKK